MQATDLALFWLLKALTTCLELSFSARGWQMEREVDSSLLLYPGFPGSFRMLLLCWGSSRCCTECSFPAGVPGMLRGALLPCLGFFWGCVECSSLIPKDVAWDAPSLPALLQKLHRALLPFPVPGSYQGFCTGCVECSLHASFHGGCCVGCQMLLGRTHPCLGSYKII